MDAKVPYERRPLPPSLYADTARAPVSAPALERDCTVSVAVVGAGYTGLSTALHLAQAGVDTVAIDAHEPGWGASGRNGGQVNPGLKHDPDEVERDFGPDLGRRMVALAGSAPQAVFDLVERHRIDCEAKQSGTIRAAVAASSLERVRAAAQQWLARGAPVEFLDADAAARATGTRRYRGAFLDRRGGSVNPLGYARGLADAAGKAGAGIYGATPALKLKRDGKFWQIETPSATIRAEQVVIGTNGYTDGLWPRLRESIVPLYTAIAATEPLQPSVAAQIMPTRSVLYEQSNFYAYYRIDAQGRFLIGGRSHLGDRSRPEHFRHLIDYAVKLFPQLRGVRWTHFWNGQVAITTDHYPHIHEPASGLRIGLGYNGRGIAMATEMGRLLAKRTLGAAKTEIDFPITGIKPMPFHSLWPAYVEARLYFGILRGWLVDR
ncbi:MAG TPA: FAD-dependent oxidoreductase [Alphaproteobacteria bacterium]|nr:FAD-dependent oxidoreductase [Alphaproteobacteria bacterium]